MNNDTLREFANIALDAGLGLAPGAMLRIAGEMPQRELMYAVARGAYERGARFVRIDYDDVRLARIRADLCKDDYLEALSELVERESEILVKEGWSYLRIDGYESPDSMEGADQTRLTRMQRARGRAVRALREAQMSSRVPWCVMPGPTDAWARQVLGPAATAEDLWKTLIPILRLDQPDPAALLRRHIAEIEARCVRLNALHLSGLHFRGPGTDLDIGLAPESLWQGGGERTPGGTVFLPNIPTEEVFTTPDFRRTSGSVTLTRPVRIRGSVIQGGRLVFRGGEVVDYSAERGGDALGRYIETDRGARRLGEVALVDMSSPIWRSGIIFDSMLLDENASCHIALGAGYDPAFAGAESWSDSVKEDRGFNVSFVHEDLMIGSEEIDVIGRDAQGKEIPLIRRGRFVEA